MNCQPNAQDDHLGVVTKLTLQPQIRARGLWDSTCEGRIQECMLYNQTCRSSKVSAHNLLHTLNLFFNSTLRYVLMLFMNTPGIYYFSRDQLSIERELKLSVHSHKSTWFENCSQSMSTVRPGIPQMKNYSAINWGLHNSVGKLWLTPALRDYRNAFRSTYQ